MKRIAYCTFCNLSQKIYSKKHISVLEILIFGSIGAIVSFLIWRDFHWAGPVIFSVLATVTELLHRMRWRQSIKCRHCGFDPVIYRANPELAASTVKAFLEQRKNDPLYLLKPQPKIKPIIKKVKDYKPPVANSALVKGAERADRSLDI